MPHRNTRRFGLVLRDQLIEHAEYVTPAGNVNLQEFARQLPSYHYETLRKAVVGDRAPTVELIEEVSTALGIDPETFFEYGLLLAQRSFDPKVVGVEKALENLEGWVSAVGTNGAEGKSRRRKGTSLRPAPAS